MLRRTSGSLEGVSGVSKAEAEMFQTLYNRTGEGMTPEHLDRLLDIRFGSRKTNILESVKQTQEGLEREAARNIDAGKLPAPNLKGYSSPRGEIKGSRNSGRTAVEILHEKIAEGKIKIAEKQKLLAEAETEMRSQVNLSSPEYANLRGMGQKRLREIKLGEREATERAVENVRNVSGYNYEMSIERRLERAVENVRNVSDSPREPILQAVARGTEELNLPQHRYSRMGMAALSPEDQARVRASVEEDMYIRENGMISFRSLGYEIKDSDLNPVLRMHSEDYRIDFLKKAKKANEDAIPTADNPAGLLNVNKGIDRELSLLAQVKTRRASGGVPEEAIFRKSGTEEMDLYNPSTFETIPYTPRGMDAVLLRAGNQPYIGETVGGGLLEFGSRGMFGTAVTGGLFGTAAAGISGRDPESGALAGAVSALGMRKIGGAILDPNLSKFSSMSKANYESLVASKKPMNMGVQTRHLTLSGAMLGGVAFSKRKRRSRGFNRSRGNRF